MLVLLDHLADVLFEVFILFAFFSLLLILVDKPFVKKIVTALNIEEALGYKKELLKKRKTFLIAFIIIIVLFEAMRLIAASSASDPNFAVSTFLRVAVLCIVLPFYLDNSNKHHKFLGNMSIVKAADFLATGEKYVLYLRGFESDVYNPRKANKKDFSEDTLSKVVLNGLALPLVAVGMTKEVDCPQGGKRVYVNDETWEKEVLELMHKAEKIIYRVNDRKSCVWEIEKSAEMLHKCVFVVDDLLKYRNVKFLLKEVLVLPNIPDSEFESSPLEIKGVFALPNTPDSEFESIPSKLDSRRFYFTSENKMIPFNGELSDYCQMIGLNPDAVSKSDIKDKHKPFFKRPFFIFLIILPAIRNIGKLITYIILLFQK